MSIIGRTTDATPTDILKIPVSEGTARTLEVCVTAREALDTPTEFAAFVRRGLFSRDIGGNVTVKEDAAGGSTRPSATTSTMDCVLEADTTAQTVDVKVTGVAGKTIAWTVEVKEALSGGKNDNHLAGVTTLEPGHAFSGDIKPATDNTTDLGSAARQYRAVYAVTGYLSDTQAARTTDTVFYSSDGTRIYRNTAAGFRSSLDVFSKSETWSTGDVKLTLKIAADSGWVLANDGTIGDASSGATTRANADCQALFTLLWNNVSDTYAPVTGGRGASAAADWAAHKKIALTKLLGRTLAVAGAGSGLTSRALGETLGEESHTLTSGEVPATSLNMNSVNLGTLSLSHGNLVQVGGSGDNLTGGSVNHQAVSPTVTIPPFTPSGAVAGGGGAHNNMQPTSFLNVMIKL